MANVLLTTRCNLSCEYCFAKEKLYADHKLAMSMSDVEKVIGFLNRSGHRVFRAMGGEPTLHPQFPRIVQMALQSGMCVDVLSNATWPESCNTLFKRISPQRLFFLLNVDHPNRYAPRLWEQIEHNLAAVSVRGNITLSFNIFETRPRYEYVLELRRKRNINKIRMSFSLPVLSMQNAYLHLEDYKSMAPFIVEFVRRAEEIGVRVSMDNAVPLCMFTYEQAGELLMKGVVDFKRNSRCRPVIDIGPDLKVWCCFCLSRLWNRHLDDFQTLQEIEEYYLRALSLYQCRLYPLDECQLCKYRELWGCQGGCLTFTVNRYGEPALEEARVQPQGEDWKPGTVLAFSPDVEITHYDIPVDSYVVHNKLSGLEMEVDASFQPLLTMLDGRYSAQELVERFVENGNSSQSQGVLADFVNKATKRCVTELLSGMLHRGFVVERHA